MALHCLYPLALPSTTLSPHQSCDVTSVTQLCDQGGMGVPQQHRERALMLLMFNLWWCASWGRMRCIGSHGYQVVVNHFVVVTA